MSKYWIVTLCFFNAFWIHLGQAEDKRPRYKVGVLLPLTGYAEVYGSKVLKGIQAAQHPGVEFILQDDQCDAIKGLSGYRALKDLQGVQLFLGPVCPQAYNVLLPLFAKHHQVAMGLCAGLSSVYKQSDERFFLPMQSAEEEGAFNGNAMNLEGIKRAVIILPEMEFTRAQERGFRSTFSGEIVGTFAFPVTDLVQMQDIVNKLRTLNFDAVFIPLVEPFLNRIMTRMSAAGIKDKSVYSIFSVEIPEVLQAEGMNANGLRYSYPAYEGSEEAAVYYAKAAAEIFAEVVVSCKGIPDCTARTLASRPDFKNGIRQVRLIQKKVEAGKFVEVK